MRELVEGSLAIKVKGTLDGALTLTWTGVANDPNPARFLSAYLEEARGEAARQGLALELRFDSLEYCNSATLGVIAGLIQRWEDTSCRLICVFDPSRRWQKLSLDALRVFETEGGLVELRGG